MSPLLLLSFQPLWSSPPIPPQGDDDETGSPPVSYTWHPHWHVLEEAVNGEPARAGGITASQGREGVCTSQGRMLTRAWPGDQCLSVAPRLGHTCILGQAMLWAWGWWLNCWLVCEGVSEDLGWRGPGGERGLGRRTCSLSPHHGCRPWGEPAAPATWVPTNRKGFRARTPFYP